MVQLFLATAVTMYRNIDTIEALAAITNWLNLLKNVLPGNFLPHGFLLAVLKLVLAENIFTDRDTWWLQIKGCTIGVVSTCAYVMSIQI